MPSVDIKIKNLPQIKAAFGKAPFLMSKELNLAIRKSIFTIQRSSMIKTPVDTGRLRASTRSLFDNLKGEVGTHTNYDIYIHDGTRYIKARPYLSDAVNEENDTVNRYFTQAVDNVLSAIGRAI